MSCYHRTAPPRGVTPWRNKRTGVKITALKCNMCSRMRPVEYFTLANYRKDGTPVQRVGCHFCLNQTHAWYQVMRPLLDKLSGEELRAAVSHTGGA